MNSNITNVQHTKEQYEKAFREGVRLVSHGFFLVLGGKLATEKKTTNLQ